MPKTIIKIKTWRCKKCNYAQDFEQTKENIIKHFKSDLNFKSVELKENTCPSCAIKGVIENLTVETESEKQMTLTVMGEEDIETEIEEAKKGNRKDIDVSTPAKENAHRNKRKEDIRRAIIEARKLEDN